MLFAEAACPDDTRSPIPSRAVDFNVMNYPNENNEFAGNSRW